MDGRLRAMLGPALGLALGLALRLARLPDGRDGPVLASASLAGASPTSLRERLPRKQERQSGNGAERLHGRLQRTHSVRPVGPRTK